MSFKSLQATRDGVSSSAIADYVIWSRVPELWTFGYESNQAMITKSLVAGFIAVLLVSCASPGGHGISGESDANRFKYAAMTFDHNNTQVVFQGRMSRRHFQEWFKADYPVGGERVEIPKDATSFGALVLTDGDEILLMPFYTWGDERSAQFACHGREFGRAPKFAVLEQSEKSFLDSMKRRLESLE